MSSDEAHVYCIMNNPTARHHCKICDAGHNVVLEIQATMPSPPATLDPYMHGVYIAYAVTAWCYSKSLTLFLPLHFRSKSDCISSTERGRKILIICSNLILWKLYGTFLWPWLILSEFSVSAAFCESKVLSRSQMG